MWRKIALLALVENDAALQYVDFFKIKLEGFFLSFNRKKVFYGTYIYIIVILLVSFNILWYGRCRWVCTGLAVIPKDENLPTVHVYQILQWKTLTFLADVLLSYGVFFFIILH